MEAVQQQSAKTLYNDPVLSDVKIKQICDGKTREYFAHRAILCAQSGYFMNMFTGNFQETTDNAIDLRDDDPDHFEFALRFIYTLQCDPDDIDHGATKDALEQMQFLMGVHTVADKYGIKRLVNPVRCYVERLFKGCDDIEVLSAIVKSHYTKWPQSNHITGKLISVMLLNTRHKFTQSSFFRPMCKSFPSFAVDVMFAMGILRCEGCFNTIFLGKTYEQPYFYCSYCYTNIIKGPML